MFCCVCLRRFVYRKLLTFMLFCYFLMILLCLATLEMTEPRPKEEESFSLIFPEPTFHAKQEPFSFHKNYSSNRLIKGQMKNISSAGVDFRTARPRRIKVQFQQPSPLSEPVIDVELHKGYAGDFVSIGKESFVYSIFLDSRKEQSFVRILTLMSQKSSTLLIYCHFNDTPGDEPRKSEEYQLCENHEKLFGGFIYSCRIPDYVNIKSMTSLVISLTKYGPKVEMPVLSIAPPKHKLAFLDSYPRSSLYSIMYNKMNTNSPSVPLTVNQEEKSPNAFVRNANSTSSQPSLSFAICVSPLFGSISVHRLIEFIELSRILGADHFYFYNHSLTMHASVALDYYVNRNIATVLPWKLPPEVDSDIWYHGQLLANNDCLYRSMPHHDLVSFNDLDEFIVPHTAARTWREAFSSMLTKDRCGFSFQSAFYDPGIRTSYDNNPLTPQLTARSQGYSKVRTKVMLCPWRVFEVGIHHISKQNREDWRPWGVEPSIAFLHHYRRCIANYGMKCGAWTKDTIIADRYQKTLTHNFQAALSEMSTRN